MGKRRLMREFANLQNGNRSKKRPRYVPQSLLAGKGAPYNVLIGKGVPRRTLQERINASKHHPAVRR